MEKTVGGVTLPYPIMIGAGVCKTPVSARLWLETVPVVSGSYTVAARPGNSGSKLFYPDSESDFIVNGFGLNSFGMPNPSLDMAINGFSQPSESVYPLIVSIAGFSVLDYLVAYHKVAQTNVVACEANFGCPNTTDHRDIMSFDPESLEEVFNQIRQSKLKLPFWAKFSPYSNPAELKRVAALVNDYPDVVKAVVTCNTFPNAYAGVSAISPNGGLAGLSGKALKTIALGQVRQFRNELKPEIDVIGVGGITTGDDVVDFFEAGAGAVQLTSMPFWSQKPSEFWDRLTASKRLLDYLEYPNM